jgi:hypothetical protein
MELEGEQHWMVSLKKMHWMGGALPIYMCSAHAGSLWRAATMADPGYTPNYGAGAPDTPDGKKATPTHPYVPTLLTAHDVMLIALLLCTS